MNGIARKLANNTHSHFTNLVLACGAVMFEFRNEDVAISASDEHGGMFTVHGPRGAIHVSAKAGAEPFLIRYIARRDLT